MEIKENNSKVGDLLDRVNYELYSGSFEAEGVEKTLEIPVPAECREAETLIAAAIVDDLFGWNTFYDEDPSRALRSAVKDQKISVYELNFNVSYCDGFELSARVSYSSTPSERWLKQLMIQCQIEFRRACSELAIELLESEDPAEFTAELSYNADREEYEVVSKNGEIYLIGFAWYECGITETVIIEMVQKELQPDQILIEALNYSPFKKWREDLIIEYF